MLRRIGEAVLEAEAGLRKPQSIICPLFAPPYDCLVAVVTCGSRRWNLTREPIVGERLTVRSAGLGWCNLITARLNASQGRRNSIQGPGPTHVDHRGPKVCLVAQERNMLTNTTKLGVLFPAKARKARLPGYEVIGQHPHSRHATTSLGLVSCHPSACFQLWRH